MRRHRRRPIYYTTFSLHDGTITCARPIRKPSAKSLKDSGDRIDADNICKEYFRNGQELSDIRVENRFRFLDIITNAMNTRRILREMILPELQAIKAELVEIRELIAAQRKVE